jgi:hypothetical protein
VCHVGHTGISDETPFVSVGQQFESIGHQFVTLASSATQRIVGSVPMNELLETPLSHGTTVVSSLETVSQAMDTSWYLYCSRHVSISTKDTTVTTETVRETMTETDTAECIQSQYICWHSYRQGS